MTNPNFNLLGLDRVADPGERFQQGFEAQRRRNALTAIASDPSNPAAANALMEFAPRLAMDVREGQRREAEHDRETVFRKAAGSFLGGEPNAMQAFAANALPGAAAPQQGPFGGPLASSSTLLDRPSSTPVEQPAPNNRAFTGEGASRGEMLRLMYQADPELALRLARNNSEALHEYTERYREVNRWAIEMLGGVTDQASWDRMIQRADGMYRRLGLNVRELVPAEYPGPVAVRQLLMGAMEADEQLAAQDRRHNIDADNERQDRNVDNQIENRDARTGIARERLNVTRRGQDIASEDRRRGQDIRSEDTRRGQDIGPRRTRRTRRTGGGSQTSRAEPETAIDANGNRIRVNADRTAWEPAE